MILVCAGALGALQTPSGSERPEARTIREGVYTLEQARRGESVAWVDCFECHSDNEWSDPRFMEGEWGGRRVGDLYTVIRRSMPEQEPGRLTPQQYSDIVAYMLWLSDAPQGENELPTDLQVLDRIFIQPSDAP